MDDTPNPKQAAGEAAAAEIQDGMQVGLGTGSTAAFAIAALGRRVREEGLQIIGTPTSFDAERMARRHGIRTVTLADIDYLDLAFDGADEVDPSLNAIKGRGAAHTREKIVASLARRFVLSITEDKLSETLCSKAAVPIEIVPMAEPAIMRQLQAMGGQPELRTGGHKDGPVVTDQGLWVIDVRFSTPVGDLNALATAIKAIPGVLDHGLFLGMATEVFVGLAGGGVRRLTRSS